MRVKVPHLLPAVRPRPAVAPPRYGPGRTHPSWDGHTLLVHFRTAITNGVHALAAPGALACPPTTPRRADDDDAAALQRLLLRQAWKKITNPFALLQNLLPVQNAPHTVGDDVGTAYAFGDFSTTRVGGTLRDLFEGAVAAAVPAVPTTHVDVLVEDEDEKALANKPVLDRLRMVCEGAPPARRRPSAARVAVAVHQCMPWVQRGGSVDGRHARCGQVLNLVMKNLANIACVAYPGDTRTRDRSRRVGSRYHAEDVMGKRLAVDCYLAAAVMELHACVPAVDKLVAHLDQLYDALQRYKPPAMIVEGTFHARGVLAALHAVRLALTHRINLAVRASRQDIHFRTAVVEELLPVAWDLLHWAERHITLRSTVLESFLELVAAAEGGERAGREAARAVQWFEERGIKTLPVAAVRMVDIVAASDTAKAQKAIKHFETFNGLDMRRAWARLAGHCLVRKDGQGAYEAYKQCGARGISNEGVTRECLAILLEKRGKVQLDKQVLGSLLKTLPRRVLKEPSWRPDGLQWGVRDWQALALRQELSARSMVQGAGDAERVEVLAAMLLKHMAAQEHIPTVRVSERQVLSGLLRVRQSTGNHKGCFAIFRRLARRGAYESQLTAQYLREFILDNNDVWQDPRSAQVICTYWDEVLRHQKDVVRKADPEARRDMLRRLYAAFAAAGRTADMRALETQYRADADFQKFKIKNAQQGGMSPVQRLVAHVRGKRSGLVVRELRELAATAREEGLACIERPVQGAMRALRQSKQHAQADALQRMVLSCREVPGALKAALSNTTGDPSLNWVYGDVPTGAARSR